MVTGERAASFPSSAKVLPFREIAREIHRRNRRLLRDCFLLPLEQRSPRDSLRVMVSEKENANERPENTAIRLELRGYQCRLSDSTNCKSRCRTSSCSKQYGAERLNRQQRGHVPSDDRQRHRPRHPRHLDRGELRVLGGSLCGLPCRRRALASAGAGRLVDGSEKVHEVWKHVPAAKK